MIARRRDDSENRIPTNPRKSCLQNLDKRQFRIKKPRMGKTLPRLIVGEQCPFKYHTKVNNGKNDHYRAEGVAGLTLSM